jgi:hypothetical protein
MAEGWEPFLLEEHQPLQHLAAEARHLPRREPRARRPVLPAVLIIPRALQKLSIWFDQFIINYH